MNINYPGMIAAIRSVRFRRAPSEAPPEPTSSTPGPTVRHPVNAGITSPCIQLTRLELDPSSSWPPKLSTSPVTINSLVLVEDYFNDFDVILCDEASQVSEPVFAAILSRLPKPRHVYVGDLHQ
ncbi:unnamed protein product, partial [Heligmosomoides polygyrus]|uniref:AAA_11 domain-containing protein n=1 Tax=Heligmosomoides polygyrus TaxID=6339 RepID=A0A183FCE6_HELPZ